MTKAISAELFFRERKAQSKERHIVYTKGISAIIATIMLLMITVALIGVFYVFSSTMVTQTTSSGGAQVSQITSQLSSCMQIRHIIGNQITLENCGKGVIENKSLVVMMDDVKLGASANTINERESGIVNVSGLWQIPPGKHNLKISNGAGFALALVDVQPNKDGLAGSWNFNEGSGTSAYDASGNKNTGTLVNMANPPTAASGWTSAGKYGGGLRFDGENDYVQMPNSASLNPSNITLEAWFNVSGTLYTRKALIQKAFTSHIDPYYQYTLLLMDSVGNPKSVSFHITVGGISYAAAVNNANYGYGRWHHLVGTYDGETMYLYLDSVLVATNTGPSGGITSYNTVLELAAYPNLAKTSASCFAGTIDEVRVWNRALAPDETATMKQLI